MMSQVTFYKDLGFDRAHANVRDFATSAARDAWFASHAESPFPQVCNYNKVQNSFDLEIQYDDAIRYGYCKVSYLDGTGQPTGFSDYCFIDSVQLINDRVCRFELTVDPWQTYMFKSDGTPGFTLERSFVVRAHVDRWGSGSTPEMQIYPNEGIDGFAVVSESSAIAYNHNTGEPDEVSGMGVMWIFMSRTAGSDTQKNIEYLLVPYMGAGDTVTLVDGGDDYLMPSMTDITSGKFFVDTKLDPESFQSIGIIPFTGAAFTMAPNYLGRITDLSFMGFSHEVVPYGTGYAYIRIGSPVDVTDIGDSVPITVDRPVKPTVPSSNDWDDLDEDMEFEPVMYMSPVRKVWLYDGSGAPLMSFPDDVLLRSNGTVDMHVYFLPGAAGAENRFAVGTPPEASGSIDYATLPEADALGRTGITTDTKLDVASNSWLSYVVTQRDTVMQTQYLNSEKAVVSGVSGAIGSVLSGDIGGAVSGLLGTGYSVINMERERQINEQGIKNQTAGVLSSGSGVGLSYARAQAMKVVRTRADDTTMEMFFDKIRYEGYNIRRYMTPDLRSRRVFNYIATMGAVVRGDMPEDIRSQLQGIFDGGVTIWHDSYDYDTNIANIERSLTTAPTREADASLVERSLTE